MRNQNGESLDCRVLHVIGGLIGGGAEAQLKLLISGVSSSSFKSAVAYINDDCEFLDREGITFYQIERSGRIDMASVWKALSHAMDDFMPDIVHLWYPEVLTIPAAIIAKSRGIDIVSTQRHRLGGTVSLGNKLRDLIGCLSHCMARRIVTNYDVSCEPWWFRRCFNIRNGCVIRNAIALKTNQRRGLFYENPKTMRVLFVGRFVYQKRIELLLEALTILKARGVQFSLDLYGKGTETYESQIKELAESLELIAYIRFNGYNDKWQNNCNDYDVLVLPSITEGMPNVVVEAMALGLPVLASDIPELSSFVQSGRHATLSKPNDADALAAALQQLQTSAETLNQYQVAGLELAGEFTLERMVTSYEKMYMGMRAENRKN